VGKVSQLRQYGLLLLDYERFATVKIQAHDRARGCESERAMPITPYLKGKVFSPEETRVGQLPGEERSKESDRK